MHCLLIRNARIVTPYCITEPGWLFACDGIIRETGTGEPPQSLTGLPDREDVDAGGLYLSPGFIDLHTHGAGGHDFMDATAEAFRGAAAAHARHGTTMLLPTTLSGSPEELSAVFEAFRVASTEAVAVAALESEADFPVGTNTGARMPGLHLEGPYFALSQRGAQDPRYIRDPDPREYEAVLAACPGLRRWSAAPELPGALPFGRRLRERGILAAIGHSDAVYEEVCAAFENGFTHVTHLYSAMSGVTRVNGWRRAGVIESAFLLEDMTVEIIADGAHLPEPLLKLVHRIKGSDRIALVTDSMRAAGMPEGSSLLGSRTNGQPVIVEDGVAKLPDRTAFAGSVATADRLVRTMTRLAEIPLWEAVRMMTRTPAVILGESQHVGTLDAGKWADLVLFDEDVTVFRTFVGGRTVYAAASMDDSRAATTDNT